MVALWQDTRHGLRMPRRNLRFTVVAVLTLGIGIGAITAIYSMIDALVLQMALVNEQLTRRFWPGQSAVGKRLTLHVQRERASL